MTQEARKTVWVVAWEYDGGGGFDWYHDQDAALRAYDAECSGTDWAAFLFAYETDANASGDDTTTAIDSDLIQCCANASVRKVGANILALWLRNGWSMGDAANRAQ